MKKVGLMVSEIPFSNMPVLLKASGLDFFILDYEHGSFDYSAMYQMITNAKLSGIECIVRLPNNERKDIIKLLDMGASGLLLPMTSTKEDIEKFLGITIDVSSGNPNQPTAPGQLLRHYAPQKTLSINVTSPARDEFFIGFGKLNGNLNLSPGGSLSEAASNLFAFLRLAESQYSFIHPFLQL